MPHADNSGTQIHYEVGGSGSEPLVLIGGLGQPGAAWGPVAELLRDSYRVVVIEPRGCGDSDTPDAPYTPDLVAGDVAAVLDATGIDAAHFLGLSMGGMITQDFVIRFPERVRSMVLLSTLATPDRWFTRLFTVRQDLIHRIGVQEHLRVYFMFVFSPFSFRQIPDRVAAVEAGLQKRPPDEGAYLRQVSYCLGHDATGDLASVRAPTLVITGSHDSLCPVPLGTELAAAIPNAEFRRWEGASHALWLEHSEELVGVCDEFIRGRS
jgi:pimeloyl-ACP methyl ester carboxylesterase